MSKKRQFSIEEARSIGGQLKIDWSQIDLEQFRRGLATVSFCWVVAELHPNCSMEPELVAIARP